MVLFFFNLHYHASAGTEPYITSTSIVFGSLEGACCAILLIVTVFQSLTISQVKLVGLVQTIAPDCTMGSMRMSKIIWPFQIVPSPLSKNYVQLPRFLTNACGNTRLRNLGRQSTIQPASTLPRSKHYGGGCQSSVITKGSLQQADLHPIYEGQML